jgi:hypothetical protein
VQQRKIALAIKIEAAGSRRPEGSWHWFFFVVLLVVGCVLSNQGAVCFELV